MDEEEAKKVLKKTYQRGYQNGFEDACDLIEGNMSELKAAMLEGLESCSLIDNFPKEVEEK